MGVSTPQPFRVDNPPRNSWESELWDDMANAIFSSQDTSLVIPMPVAGRIHIEAQGSMSVAGDFSMDVDGSTASFVPTTTAPGPVCMFYDVDVPVGLHTVNIQSFGGVIDTYQISARRGRKPV